MLELDVAYLTNLGPFILAGITFGVILIVLLIIERAGQKIVVFRAPVTTRGSDDWKGAISG